MAVLIGADDNSICRETAKAGGDATYDVKSDSDDSVRAWDDVGIDVSAAVTAA